MPKNHKSRISSKAAAKTKMIMGVAGLMLIIVGLAAGYLLLQKSQENRSSASVKNGLATVTLDGPKTVKPGEKVTVSVYISTKANLNSLRLQGTFSGVTLKSASFQPTVKTGTPNPSSTPAPSPKSGTPFPSPIVTPNPHPSPTSGSGPSSPIPIPSATTLQVDGHVQGASTGVSAPSSVKIVTNQVTKSAFSLLFESASANEPWPAGDKQLLGTFTFVPTTNGQLTIIIGTDSSQALIFGTKTDTLNTPSNFVVQVGHLASSAPKPTAIPVPTVKPTSKPTAVPTPILKPMPIPTVKPTTSPIRKLIN